MPSPSPLVALESLVHHTQTETARLDIQPFPFIDLYGIAGHVSGRAKNFDLTLSPMHLEFTPHWDLTLEGGFMGRWQGLACMGFRF